MIRSVSAVLLSVATTAVAQQHFEPSTLRSLFDGETLAGWVERGGRYDGEATWTVEDGAITGRQGPGRAGGLIYTERYYTNFLFAADVKIDEPFDSGIFVRMVPRREGGKGAQITLDARPGGEIGGIYSDGFLQHGPTLAESSLRHGAWNRVEVLCIGPRYRLEFWLNGEQVTAFELPPDAEGFAPRGRIGLQVHGSRDDAPEQAVRFRNLGILELPDFDPQWFTCDASGRLAPREQTLEAGWGHLGDGLAASLDAGDFDVRLDYRVTTGAAFELRIEPESAPPPVTVRVALPKAGGAELAVCGIRADASKLRPSGAWSTLSIARRGRAAAIRIDGAAVLDLELDEGWDGAASRLLLTRELADRGAVEFRNIWQRSGGSR